MPWLDKKGRTVCRPDLPSSGRIRPASGSSPSPAQGKGKGGAAARAKIQSSPRTCDAHHCPLLSHLCDAQGGSGGGLFLPTCVSLPLGKTDSEFVIARAHTLSLYTPLCFSYGLVLCALNLPQYACLSPTCALLLLAPSARTALIAQLGTQLEALKGHETQKRTPVEPLAHSPCGIAEFPYR